MNIQMTQKQNLLLAFASAWNHVERRLDWIPGVVQWVIDVGRRLGATQTIYSIGQLRIDPFQPGANGLLAPCGYFPVNSINDSLVAALKARPHRQCR